MAHSPALVYNLMICSVCNLHGCNTVGNVVQPQQFQQLQCNWHRCNMSVQGTEPSYTVIFKPCAFCRCSIVSTARRLQTHAAAAIQAMLCNGQSRTVSPPMQATPTPKPRVRVGLPKQSWRLMVMSRLQKAAATLPATLLRCSRWVKPLHPVTTHSCVTSLLSLPYSSSGNSCQLAHAFPKELSCITLL